MAKKKNSKGKSPVYDKRKMFNFFRAALIRMLTDWDVFRHLFLITDRNSYLQQHAPCLKDSVSTQLTIAVYMGIAQLFDPLATFNDPKHSNLVLRRVIDDLAPAAGTPERNEIEGHYRAMQPTVEKIRKWRNKIGAHRSLTIALELVEYIESGGAKPHPLPFIPIKEVTDVLHGLVRITDILTLHVDGQQFQWYDGAVIPEIENLFAKLFASQAIVKVPAKSLIEQISKLPLDSVIELVVPEPVKE
jgi:hypothetical protein